jgi:FkbM family methyltransferase
MAAVEGSSEAQRRSKAERKAEKQARAAFLERARDLMPYVSVEVEQGDVFFVPTSDRRIGANLFIRAKSKDMAVLARALELLAGVGHRLPAEPVFVDVGANLGTATTTALRHHGFASAVALEPAPETFLALRLNLVANGLEERVRALQAAASDHEDEQPFDVSHWTTGAHRLVAAGAEQPERSVVVEVVTLDGLVARGEIDPARVGLVWVDTSGHEPEALAGGRRLLEAGIPVVAAVKHGSPETEDALVELLTPYYSHVGDLRGTHPLEPIEEFRRLVDALGGSTDVLLVRA